MSEELSARLQGYIDVCKTVIETSGWMIQGVFGGRDLFAYTVGLNALGVPELAIVGINDPTSAQNILNDAAKIHLEKPFVPGATVDIDWSVKFQVREVSTSGMHSARVLNGVHHQPTALQLVWPDKHGVYRKDLAVPTD